ncbi:sterol delta 5,6-desaturase ERG3, partial [Aureobasidium melanogenum]
MLAMSTVGDFAGTPNATWSTMARGITPYKFEPASQYFSVEPSSYAYMSRWPRDNIARQAISLFLITWVFGLLNYFVCAGLSYIFVFDKTTVHHPKFLKNQMRLEIRQALEAMPVMAVLTVPWFLGEVRGYSKIYDVLPESSS